MTDRRFKEGDQVYIRAKVTATAIDGKVVQVQLESPECKIWIPTEYIERRER